MVFPEGLLRTPEGPLGAFLFCGNENCNRSAFVNWFLELVELGIL